MCALLESSKLSSFPTFLFSIWYWRWSLVCRRHKQWFENIILTDIAKDASRKSSECSKYPNLKRKRAKREKFEMSQGGRAGKGSVGLADSSSGPTNQMYYSKSLEICRRTSQILDIITFVLRCSFFHRLRPHWCQPRVSSLFLHRSAEDLRAQC